MLSEARSLPCFQLVFDVATFESSIGSVKLDLDIRRRTRDGCDPGGGSGGGGPWAASAGCVPVAGLLPGGQPWHPGGAAAEMKAAVRSLFDLPDDVKLRNADVIAGSGYMCPTTVNPLYEAFGLYDAASPADVDAFCSCLDAPPHHRDTIRFYASHLRPLVASIASKIAESLGLVGYSFSDWPCQLG
uniref:Uncharacterized protein n=1 Tax=Ananas comosus var. bracteatus TaxID=296719 RepID=A0A6V7P4T2_ANACO|nr:unnamed protein product [Ananas comosus var. bracteatus]